MFFRLGSLELPFRCKSLRQRRRLVSSVVVDDLLWKRCFRSRLDLSRFVVSGPNEIVCMVVVVVVVAVVVVRECSNSLDGRKKR